MDSQTPHLCDSPALIQRQQVQIQQFKRFPEPNQMEENVKLREEISTLKSENDSLLEFIGALKENKDYQVEPGWVTVLASQRMTDPVRNHYPDSPMMKKIESLSNTNIKLFQANKDWHNKWEILRRQTQEEKAELQARVASLKAKNENLQENLVTLENQMKIQNNSLQDMVKASESAEEDKSKLQRLNELLNSQVLSLNNEIKGLVRSKKMLESQLAWMKSSSIRDHQTANADCQTEIALLKQQLAVFAEDFEKERKDRILAQNKAEKWKKERDQMKAALDIKVKKMNVQLRAQENDLRTKARQNADLMYQVEDLKLKLQREQRQKSMAAENSYNYQPPPASYQGPVSMPYNGDINSHMTHSHVGHSVNQPYANGSYTSVAFAHHQSSPEHLPGAWKCSHCTYINYPNRTVCDICGFTNTNGDSLTMTEGVSGRNELQSRGEDRRWKISDDVVVDSEPENTILPGSFNVL